MTSAGVPAHNLGGLPKRRATSQSRGHRRGKRFGKELRLGWNNAAQSGVRRWQLFLLYNLSVTNFKRGKLL